MLMTCWTTPSHHSASTTSFTVSVARFPYSIIHFHYSISHYSFPFPVIAVAPIFHSPPRGFSGYLGERGFSDVASLLAERLGGVPAASAVPAKEFLFLKVLTCRFATHAVCDDLMTPRRTSPPNIPLPHNTFHRPVLLTLKSYLSQAVTASFAFISWEKLGLLPTLCFYYYYFSIATHANTYL